MSRRILYYPPQSKPQRRSGLTPLSLLFRCYRKRVRCVIHALGHINRHGVERTTTIANGKITHEDRKSETVPTTSAAASVRGELGELSQKARLMVCLMAEKRLEREREDELSSLECIVEKGICGLEGMGDPSSMTMAMGQASAAAMVAMEAAKWAKQQHQHQSDDEEDHGDDDDIIGEGYGMVDGTASVGAAAVGNGCGSTTRKFRLVHASVGLTGYGCPPEMIRLAASVYPQQVREMDEEGNLPLHIASVASSFLPTPPPDNDNTGNDSEGGDEGTRTFSDEDSLISGLSTVSGISALSGTTGEREPNPFDKVIRMLLRIYPAAVRIPHGRTGRLPLVLAIEGRKRTMDDGIRALLETHPAALESMDIDPKLYPRILAVVGQPKETKKKIRRGASAIRRLRKKNGLVERNIPTALFETLQAKPELVSIGADSCMMLEG